MAKSPASKEGKLKVIDTYVRAIEKLSRLAPEVAALEQEVAERESEVLRKILRLLDPVLPKLVGPVALREPWLDGAEKGEPRPLGSQGVIVERTFSQHRVDPGMHLHRSQLVLIGARGQLVVVNESARWTDPGHAGARWEVDSREVELTPEFAAEHLRGILAGILEILRLKLERDIEEKHDLKERLERLEEAERALG